MIITTFINQISDSSLPTPILFHNLLKANNKLMVNIVGTNTHTRIKETVQRYLSSFERFQEELLSLKDLRARINQPLELTIDLSETDDLMEAVRKYEADLKRGQDDPTWFLFKTMMVDAFFEMKKDLEKLFPKPLFLEVRKNETLEGLLSYTVEELHDLEAKLYSKNMDELDCSVCGQSSLILDEDRAEQACKNCGTVIRDKMMDEEIHLRNL